MLIQNWYELVDNQDNTVFYLNARSNISLEEAKRRCNKYISEQELTKELRLICRNNVIVNSTGSPVLSYE